jgi:hypothetical protein
MNHAAYSRPDTPELRRFGLMFSAVLAVLFGVLIPLLRHGSALGLPFVSGHWPAWPWLAAALVAAWALAHPASLHLLHRPWMRFAHIAQWVNTRIIMLLLFYVIILPIGLLLRLFGKDPMRRRMESAAQSYRIRAELRDRDHVEKPY